MGIKGATGNVFSYTALFGASFNLGPTKGYGWWQAMLCEMLCTFMLCFVVLNTAASNRLEANTNFTDLPLDLSLWRVLMAQVQCLVAASTQQLLLQLMYQA